MSDKDSREDLPAVRLSLLGTFVVALDGRVVAPPTTISRKARTLLKLLAVQRGHVLSTDQAVEVLWPEAPPARPADNVATLVGEAGIGKTVLSEGFAAEVAESGGLVLWSRCYEAERSLFLQPLVEALTPPLAAMPAHRLRDLMGEHADALAALVPAAAAALGPGSPTALPLEEERRRAFEAVLHLLRRLAVSTPVLVVLDDLHQAGRSTAEAVHYLVRHAAQARLLVVATLRREEGARLAAVLGEVSTTVDPGLLSPAGVESLAGRIGLDDHAPTWFGGPTAIRTSSPRCCATCTPVTPRCPTPCRPQCSVGLPGSGRRPTGCFARQPSCPPRSTRPPSPPCSASTSTLPHSSASTLLMPDCWSCRDAPTSSPTTSSARSSL